MTAPAAPVEATMQTERENKSMDDLVPPLIALAEANIPTDVQELLVQGDPMRGIPPGALTKAIAAALAQPASGEGWRTMDSAPKDGTHVLAVVAGNHPSTGLPFIPEVVEWSAETNGWWSEMWGVSGDYRPTHWMPLPTSPREAEGEA